jgi:hypothetical protein
MAMDVLSKNNCNTVKLGYNEQGPAIFVRYNRVHLCTKITNLTQKSVRYNRVRYNRVSL